MPTQHATCSLSASATSVRDAVRAVIREDDVGRGLFSRLGTHPHTNLSEFEGDLRDWGMVYGMVFALTRNEDPWESAESVAARALETAWPIYVEWSGQITEPEKNFAEVIGDLERAYSAAHPIIPMLLREHEEITVRLASAIEMVVQEAGHTRSE